MKHERTPIVGYFSPPASYEETRVHEVRLRPSERALAHKPKRPGNWLWCSTCKQWVLSARGFYDRGDGEVWFGDECPATVDIWFMEIYEDPEEAEED